MAPDIKACGMSSAAKPISGFHQSNNVMPTPEAGCSGTKLHPSGSPVPPNRCPSVRVLVNSGTIRLEFGEFQSKFSPFHNDRRGCCWRGHSPIGLVLGRSGREPISLVIVWGTMGPAQKRGEPLAPSGARRDRACGRSRIFPNAARRIERARSSCLGYEHDGNCSDVPSCDDAWLAGRQLHQSGLRGT